MPMKGISYKMYPVSRIPTAGGIWGLHEQGSFDMVWMHGYNHLM